MKKNGFKVLVFIQPPELIEKKPAIQSHTLHWLGAHLGVFKSLSPKTKLLTCLKIVAAIKEATE